MVKEVIHSASLYTCDPVSRGCSSSSFSCSSPAPAPLALLPLQSYIVLSRICLQQINFTVVSQCDSDSSNITVTSMIGSLSQKYLKEMLAILANQSPCIQTGASPDLNWWNRRTVCNDTSSILLAHQFDCSNSSTTPRGKVGFNWSPNFTR